jgi:hypothetical protein
MNHLLATPDRQATKALALCLVERAARTCAHLCSPIQSQTASPPGLASIARSTCE